MTEQERRVIEASTREKVSTARWTHGALCGVLGVLMDVGNRLDADWHGYCSSDKLEVAEILDEERARLLDAANALLTAAQAIRGELGPECITRCIATRNQRLDEVADAVRAERQRSYDSR